MGYLRVSALVGLGLALTSMVVNCRDHDVSMVTGAARETPSDGEQVALDRCVPGQTIECQGGCGAPSTGYQVCAADGRSFGACLCPPLRVLGPIPSISNRSDGDRRIVSRGPLLGFPTAPGVATGTGLVGAACSKDADCLSGLDCLTAGGGSLNFGGPAGGYCSVACAGDAACQALDRSSECAPVAGQRICVRTCASQAAPSGVAKCLDRTDLMCVSVAARGEEDPSDGPQRGRCLPACGSDAQCGPGLFCHLGTGLCRSERPVGAPIGSRCTGPESCASGICLTLNDSFEGFCSGVCRFGGVGCGSDGSSPAEAGCALAQIPGEGVGDRGLCLELCQSPSDCVAPGAACLATTSGSATRVCLVRTAVSLPDPGAPSGPARTGNACSENSDCGTGFQCLTPGQGFAGGYCSAACTDAPCAEPGSVCANTGPDSPGLCLRGCNPQAGGDCGERTDLRCIPFSNDDTAGFCRPDCRAGADCGEGECDPSNGLCVERPASEPPAEQATTGNTCSADADCGTGSQCFTPDQDPFDLGGGFGGGYCSRSCADAACTEAGSVCGNTGPDSAFCLRGCNPQTGGDCGERSDLRCIPFSNTATSGYCQPDCSSGADCGDRVCDPESGLCVDAPAADCTEDEDCENSQVCVAGSCLDLTAGCSSDVECAPGTCDIETQSCVAAPPECSSDSECTPGTCDLQLGQCVAAPPGCTTDAECGVQVCDPAGAVCIEAGCVLDEDCAAGVCDPGALVCTPAPAIAVGGACDVDEDCAGALCPSLDGVSSFCSAFCEFGTARGCEPYGTDAFCLVPLPAPNDDFGVCIELCDTSVDCEQAGYECLPLGTTINGRTGGCLPPAPPAAP